MAMYIFTKNILANKPLPVFNNGHMERDFTYIDDIVDGIRASMEKNHKCKVFNLGNNKIEKLMSVIKLIEFNLNKKAKLNFYEMQPGDVSKTYADIGISTKELGYSPKVNIENGIKLFVQWYLKYNKD